MDIHPFRIDVDETVLDDLRERLAMTRLPGATGLANRELDPAWLDGLCAWWQHDYDWRAQEAKLNGFRHFRTHIDGVGIHFIHERGRGESPIPLLLVHGWPDSFARFLEIIPLLTASAANGLPSFDVVVPSLPGYGWSDPLRDGGTVLEFADTLHTLMVGVLGYERFAMHGGDWGSTVTETMARRHPASLVGIHLTDVPFFHAFGKPGEITEAEQEYLKHVKEFQQKEGAYSLIQSTKPQTLAAALNDSPAGLAAWIVEKLQAWTDNDGDLERVLSRDAILTHVMIYWVTQTIASSFRPYADFGNPATLQRVAKEFSRRADQVPAAFALFPKDISTPPREWAERWFDVRRFSLMPRGGHFAAMEQPQLLADDLRETFAQAG